MSVKKIAFNLLGPQSWQAGTVYVINLLRALQMIDRNDIEFSLIRPTKDTHVPEDLRRLVPEIITYPPRQIWSRRWFIEQAFKRLLRHDLPRDRFLRRRHVNVVALAEAPKGSKIPTLSWLPDFQHIHLPQLFSPEERTKRNDSFMRVAVASSRILLLSESVKSDFESFAPPYANKARVVRPVSYVSPTVYETHPRSVADVYRLPERFIYLPNQFWKHKNHAVVFRAVGLLKDQGTEVFIVCSGILTDGRHPNYLSELLQLASHLGIWRQIVLLGLIPREHVFSLIRQSVCVLNPSLFEGFGLTVDEARSVGKRILLSDISAHREQNPPRCVFFKPTDEGDLAVKLKLVWYEQSPGPDLQLEAEAKEALPARSRVFGESFMSVVREVLP
jgi:glycosyltransferase involved in cell wall biosynthesis